MQKPVHSKDKSPLGLYLHIPFCATKCNYCDFNTYAGIEELIPAYVEALVSEVESWGRVAGALHTVETIFFGGGTPSLLPTEETRRILQSCKDAFEVDPQAEVTLESNPGDLTPSLLEGLLSSGVNRLSIGIQSFNNRHLAALTRRHSAEEAAEAFRLAREAGFANINLDLMYGLPHQSLAEWQETLDRALEISADHLSLYTLTLEEGTPLWSDVRRGAVPESDSDLAAEMYQHAEDALGRRGYGHYEISNWARPEYECRHNLVYWRNQPYLGLGAGAHSWYGGYRFSDERIPRKYTEGVTVLVAAQGKRASSLSSPEDITEELLRCIAPVDQLEVIGEGLEMAETMMLGLRLMEGVRYDEFSRKFGRTLESVYGAEIRELVDVGLLVREEEGSVRLTPRGRLLGNEVFSRVLSVRV